MTFEQALHYINQLDESRMRFDLTLSQKILERLGRPDQKLKSIIVSGTNGKGSVCAFLTSMAKQAGIKVGTYTSPHLVSPLERIAIDGTPISEICFASLVTELKAVIEQSPSGQITYFEVFTLLSTLAFVQANVELAIFEVGLGGRLDTTNILERIGTITTSIDFDHTQILGTSLSEIATEKIAIMRKNCPAIVSKQLDGVQKQIIESGKSIGTKLNMENVDYIVNGDATSFYFSNKEARIGPLHLGLYGDHQIHNAGCAAAMALELSKQGFYISSDSISKGLGNVAHPARLERWLNSKGQEVWLDVGHNPSAIKSVVKFLRKEKFFPIDIVLGVLKDKDWKKMIEELLPIASSMTLCKPQTPRAWDLDQASKEIGDKIVTRIVPHPSEAFDQAILSSSRLLCIGSFYTIGAVRPLLPKKGYQLVVRPSCIYQ